MGCCASTSPREPICRAGARQILKPSPTRSTTAPGRSSATRLQPRYSTNRYNPYNQPVLQPPVEPAQYTSQKFLDHLKTYGIRPSMGRTGVCWDNAWVESFNATLKNERVHRMVYATRQKAINDIALCIELRCNHVRLHSVLGYHTPNEVEQELLGLTKAA